MHFMRDDFRFVLVYISLDEWNQITPISPGFDSNMNILPRQLFFKTGRNDFPRRRFQSKPLVCDPDMYHGTCVTHMPGCMSGSLTCGDRETFPAFPAQAHPQCYVSGNRPVCRMTCHQRRHVMTISKWTWPWSYLQTFWVVYYCFNAPTFGSHLIFFL